MSAIVAVGDSVLVADAVDAAAIASDDPVARNNDDCYRHSSLEQRKNFVSGSESLAALMTEQRIAAERSRFE